MNEAELFTEYRDRYDRVFVHVAKDLEDLLKRYLTGERHVDRIVARAKDPDRFVKKASKTESNGSLRYSEPFVQIQDIVGARVVVFYKSDVDRIEAVVRKYFFDIERLEHVPDSYWEFGYFGKHLILKTPADAVPPCISLDDAPGFFELQIKTLFQHAWSEAEHDLSYKAPQELGPEQQRTLAYTSAMAWGADEAFLELTKELAV